MKEYTTEIHAKRVQTVITEEHPNCHCPVTQGHERPTLHAAHKLCAVQQSSCRICRAFIGIPAEEAVCPCDYYGEIDAVKRTWIALKEYHKGGENANNTNNYN